MPLRSIYNQNIGFIEQVLYFWALQKGSNNKGSINWHYFCLENIFLVTFLELPPIGLCQYYTKICCSIGDKQYKVMVNESTSSEYHTFTRKFRVNIYFRFYLFGALFYSEHYSIRAKALTTARLASHMFFFKCIETT